MDSPKGTAQLLPGMADLSGHKGPTLTAIVEQLQQWKAAGTLSNEHIALAQLAVALATSIDTMLSSGKVSMLSNNAHELRETLEAIAGKDTGGNDVIKQLMDELNNADA